VAFNRFSFLSNFPFISIPTINRLSASLEAIGAEQLAIYVADLQEKLKIKQTAQGRIALVGCETDRPSSGSTSAANCQVAVVVYFGNITIARVFSSQGVCGISNGFIV
jgi:hypothetical protein